MSFATAVCKEALTSPFEETAHEFQRPLVIFAAAFTSPSYGRDAVFFFRYKSLFFNAETLLLLELKNFLLVVCREKTFCVLFGYLKKNIFSYKN